MAQLLSTSMKGSCAQPTIFRAIADIPLKNTAQRADGFGLPGVTVDGNNPLTSYVAAVSLQGNVTDAVRRLGWSEELSQNSILAVFRPKSRTLNQSNATVVLLRRLTRRVK